MKIAGLCLLSGLGCLVCAEFAVCVGGLEPLCALNAWETEAASYALNALHALSLTVTLLRLDRNLGPSTVYLTLLSVLDTSILV